MEKLENGFYKKFEKKYLRDLNEPELKEILNKFDNGTSIIDLSSKYEINSAEITKFLRWNKRNILGEERKYFIIRAIPFTQKQKEIIIGTVLGDGCLHKHNKSKDFALSLTHCKQQEEYFLWKTAMLSPFVNTYRQSFSKKGTSIFLDFTSRQHPELNPIANMFYDSSRIKHVPENISDFMTPLALAVWHMDDGDLKTDWCKEHISSQQIRLSTQSFDEKEHEILIDMFKKVFNIDAFNRPYKFRDKMYNRLYIGAESAKIFSNIVRPFIIDSMKYKIIPSVSPETICETSKDEDIART